jgi:hypothetical protein
MDHGHAYEAIGETMVSILVDLKFFIQMPGVSPFTVDD